ncbi:MBOAT family protein [Turicibacter sanguinis]|uniref:MBOAT family O-acyltransferase n=1 Tax=Turicibacter sanguinis TaxID=154288 RepID=UPI0012B7115D|nr:MBOAT family protein [Turicibacter sanguinis]MTH11081.1 MBOAT family protein [Turicibacter sanguinis]MTH13848.1 MBOAT family protein [Turicibacter sanguinis]MTH20953.1 MBOAT family protein [Turicibacter sanguinis]MTH41792.1 MBOAT family protein [Turicibacter sanguinis]
MLFSSMLFLWIFLPLVLVLHWIIPKKLHNLLLLGFSLLFYTFGEPKYILLMLISIAMNYLFGLLVDFVKTKNQKRLIVTITVLTNLLILGYFKYFNFFIESINNLFNANIFELKDIILPIGISFYTFQALSYVVDLYRGDIKVQKNIFNLALYISFFPQLIAGPIIKYHDIDKQIIYRETSLVKMAYGIKRFIYGLGKKVIISNSLAMVADQILNIETYNLSTVLVWVAMICYTLQIYFDFSGYSDMAIGLGKMFGFDFIENFNYPYTSKSIQEFWRRWHISLSTWFKEYLYIPLGGNRKGVVRTYLNLLIVFFATGFWHGAGFNFIFWGLFHGFFQILERLGLNKLLKKIGIFSNLYVILVVIVGWVFFRANNFEHAMQLLKIMFFPQTNSTYSIFQFIDIKIIILIIFAILFSGVIQRRKQKLLDYLYNENEFRYKEILILFLILLSCQILLVSNSYNPFIYFRF